MNVETDAARRSRATAAVGWALRELTANLIRVSRGAGKSYEIVRQIAASRDALAEYLSVVGHLPSSAELDDMLRLSSNAHNSWARAERTIIRGALQVAASSLVEQNTQKQAGLEEVHRGVDAIEQLRKPSS